MVSWTVESWGPLFAVFRTTDGGRTWQRSMQNSPFNDDINLPDNFGIQFVDSTDGTAWFDREYDGLLPISVETGTRVTRFIYRTSDGSMTWRYDGRTTAVLGCVPQPPPPFHVEEKNNIIRVLRLTREGFQFVGTLPATYRIHDDGSVEPQ